MADSLTNSELLVMSTVLHLNNHTYGVPIVHELERNRRRMSVATVYVVFATFLIEAPLAIATGWTAARLARRCRIPAVFGMAGSLLVVGAWNVWKNTQIAWAADSLGRYFTFVWPFLLPIPLLPVLVLFGGGLLTGSPKRSIRT